MLTTYQRQRYRTWADTEPMPAEAATEVGADDMNAATGICIGTMLALSVWLVAILAVIAVFA